VTKRVRYVGPYEEVAVFDSEAGVYAPPVAIVQKGHLLPEDVPARIREEFAHKDNEWWAEVKHETPKADDDKKGDA
jgi:hypothetical protein